MSKQACNCGRAPGRIDHSDDCRAVRSPTPGPLGHAFTEGWTGFEGKPQDRCYRIVQLAIENGKYDIRCGYGRDAHLPPAAPEGEQTTDSHPPDQVFGQVCRLAPSPQQPKDAESPIDRAIRLEAEGLHRCPTCGDEHRGPE